MNHFFSSENEPCLEDADPACRGSVEVCLSPHVGGPTATFRLRYCFHGDATEPWRVVAGGISASECPDEWWRSQVGRNRAIDPEDGAVLGIEYLGSRPERWKGVSTFDQAAAVAAVLDELGVETIDAFIGASYGGCVGLSFAIRYPARVKRVLAISASHRPSPMTTALRSIQRNLVRQGLQEQDLSTAITLARALAMTTYRTEEEFAQRFAGEPIWNHDRWRFPVEDYLEARGCAFADSFDANRYLVLSESLDLHRIDPETLSVPLHLFAVREDRVIPVQAMRDLADATGASLETISSRYGHDAFLKEEEAVAKWLQTHLKKKKRRRARMRKRVACLCV